MDLARLSKGAILAIAGAVLAVALVIGMWQGGVWFSNKADATAQSLQLKHLQRQKALDIQSASNQAAAAQGNYGTQEGYITQITNDMAAVASDIASYQSYLAPGQGYYLDEAEYAAGQACQQATLLTGSVPEPAGMSSWLKVNCSGGALALDSPIRTGKDG